MVITWNFEKKKKLGKKENTSTILLKIMNKIHETGEVPTDWKMRMIHVINEEKGDKGNQSNYRGISLLLTVSNIYTIC
jgi:hypothetical protein